MLHMVVRPPWAGDALARALDALAPGDVLLLAQDAVAAAVAPAALEPRIAARLVAAGARVLGHDLAARGIAASALPAGLVVVDDAAWVELAATCDACVTWA